jgi:hypothetical protein
MARPKRLSVDFFPHYVKGGRTIFILEERFGNDGYAFWFKLLESLGERTGHCLDCNDATEWSYFLAKAHVPESDANQIIDTLVQLGKIDAHLWQKHRLVWVQNLVDNFTEIYRKRGMEVPSKPTPAENTTQLSEDNDRGNATTPDVFATENPQSKVKESKVKKRAKALVDCDEVATLWNTTCCSLPKVMSLNADRRKKIELRASEMTAAGGDPKEEFVKVFETIEASDFLAGRTGKKWKATFDWILANGSNWVKVAEGNYDNEGASRPVSASDHRLGTGERIENGRRTYGSGKASIPLSAPPRPSEQYSWNAETNEWVIL